MTSFNEPTGRPGAGEYAAYAEMDIMRVAGNDAPSALQTQRDEMLALLDGLADDAVRGVTYAPGKWTLKEVVGHLVDDERIFTYRLLCVARGDQTPQPDECRLRSTSWTLAQSSNASDLLNLMFFRLVIALLGDRSLDLFGTPEDGDRAPADLVGVTVLSCSWRSPTAHTVATTRQWRCRSR